MNISKQNIGHILSLLVFFLFFVVFIYGALFLALFEISNRLIHAYQLQFFLNYNHYGVILFVLGIVVIWISAAYLTSYFTYKLLYLKTNQKIAKEISTVVLFGFFHIFSIPCILWKSFKNTVSSSEKK